MEFGKLADGTAIDAVELSNGRICARIIALGAALQSLQVPDRNGKPGDVVLGYATAAEYLAKPQYFGATVGRYANRIRGGRFSLDGKSYQLAANDGPNHLHGGVKGFDKAVWKIDAVNSGSPASVALSHVSPDGDGGFPGTLEVTATYSLNEKNELSLEYRATTDKPTVLNLTNHSYFNLAGGGDILGHRLTLLADAYTPVDATLIPTGERRNVAGTPFDFRQPRAIGERVRDGHDEQIRFGRGYDHNYVLRDEAGTLRRAAKLEDPASGRVMELLTAAPAVQFYSGNFLDGTSIGKGGRIHRQGDALCLEPQVFPDSPNHADFPSARLNPGDTYTNVIVYRFSTAGR
ncbi:MAG TPA: aldose epimerase family protein [Povalibacter sp.]|uniref:aldose epimerase family protein n=1 Tax=Povalibacter sp. TaxID=1962978 RepID=UPI002D06B9D9|nr:aldose epimerase family protein [Povalibacter sp.]HMN45988.1 aldose epimerase family protein [Povalibacter sp.]